MTAESLVLAYWGYGTDYNPNNLSAEQQNELKNTVLLMHEWENVKMKKVKADAAAMELLNTAQEREIDKLKREVIGMDGEIQLLNERLATALTTIAQLQRKSPAELPQTPVSSKENNVASVNELIDRWCKETGKSLKYYPSIVEFLAWVASDNNSLEVPCDAPVDSMDSIMSFEERLWLKHFHELGELEMIVYYEDAVQLFNEWKKQVVETLSANRRFESGVDKVGFVYMSQIEELLNSIPNAQASDTTAAEQSSEPSLPNNSTDWKELE